MEKVAQSGSARPRPDWVTRRFRARRSQTAEEHEFPSTETGGHGTPVAGL